MRDRRQTSDRPFAMADLEAVLQAIRGSVAKLRVTSEIEEQRRRL
jgi:hypothetical protein